MRDDPVTCQGQRRLSAAARACEEKNLTRADTESCALRNPRVSPGILDSELLCVEKWGCVLSCGMHGLVVDANSSAVERMFECEANRHPSEAGQY